ncbi:MAG: thioesterase [Flavobacteriaceae bacterium]|nr:MAG: thioesterase [Flavobacteriaceae bacterium]
MTAYFYCLLLSNSNKLKMDRRFYLEHTVIQDEIDALGHVNNVCYIQWVQNAAEKHWAVLSKDHTFENYVWVVLRHEIDYIASAKLDDKITIRTWVGESYGVKSERFVEILKDGQILVKATTTWCLLDKKKMKVVRVPFEVLEAVNGIEG